MRHFSAWDITPRQYAVLIAALEQEGGSQTDIVERTGIDRSTLADLVRRLVKKGLLSRRRSREDARAYSVRLTDSGRDLLGRCEPLAQRVENEVLAGLSAGDRERLIVLLDRLIAGTASADAMS